MSEETTTETTEVRPRATDRIERAVKAISGAAAQSREGGVAIPLWVANQALIVSSIEDSALREEYEVLLGATDAVCGEGAGVPLDAVAMLLGWLQGMLEQSERVTEGERQAAMMAKLGELVAEANREGGSEGSLGSAEPEDPRDRRNVVGFAPPGYL